MWICSQIGAREHYAIPRALHKTGRLDTLYTDFWAGSALRLAQKMVDGRLKMGALRSLAARYHPELDPSGDRVEDGRGKMGDGSAEREDGRLKMVDGRRSTLVQSWNLRALWWEGMLRRSKKRTTGLRDYGTTRPEDGKLGDGRWEMGKQKAEIGKEVRSQKSDPNLQAPISNLQPQWPPALIRGFIEVGRRFAVRVRESLKHRTDLNPGTIFFAYDTGALESMEWCRERGIKCILNQMDPSRMEVELVRSEEKQWPGWALEDIQVPEAYFARREREWSLADRVVVNSEFSREALLQQGVPTEKLVVMPLCYEAEVGDRSLKIEEGRGVVDNKTTGLRDYGTTGPEDGRWEIGDEKVGDRSLKIEDESATPLPSPRSPLPSTIYHLPSSSTLRGASPLRVLFLGQVILRKGIQYLLAAARDLERENIHFDVVGPIGISRMAMATAPGNVTFHGRTGREQAADWYRRSHLFVLPTLSDGFAITQLEAMAHGLPVIATPCCGEVVSDGVDGFIVPPRDAGALARTLQRYLAQPEVLQAQRRAALEKSKQFTLERLTANLTRVEEELVDGR